MNKAPIRFLGLMRGGVVRRGAVFAGILLLALLAFEVFNYSTTEFALNDLLGSDLRFAGIRWATILALAFCGIDFAGIARLFTPQQARSETGEVWYLFGAWLLAAAMNATLTWWGVAVAVRSHQELSSLVINQGVLANVVPIFVALMVWLIRVLIIGTFSVAGERLFSQADSHVPLRNTRPVLQSASSLASRPRPATTSPYRPATKAVRPEPTYHNVSMNARSVREAEYVDTPRNS